MGASVGSGLGSIVPTAVLASSGKKAIVAETIDTAPIHNRYAGGRIADRLLPLDLSTD